MNVASRLESPNMVQLSVVSHLRSPHIIATEKP